MRAQLSNPAYGATVRSEQERLYMNKRMAPPLSIRAKRLLTKYELQGGHVKPDVSCVLHRGEKPTWNIEPPYIDMALEEETTRKRTSPQLYLQLYSEIMEKYRGWEKIFTDGSKTAAGVGAAAIWEGVVKRDTLPRQATIFTAELYGIRLAINIVRDNKNQDFIIAPDSKSVVKSLTDLESKNSMTRQLQHELWEIGRGGQRVVIIWIPGHKSGEK